MAEVSSEYLAVRVQVRWGDCDPAGIAFYPRFFEWMDLASHALTREMGISRDDMLPPESVGFPLVGASAEFLAPARFDDELEVRVWVTRTGRSSFGLRQQIVRVDDGQLLARGMEQRVHVARAADGRGRARELTPTMRAVLARYDDPEAAR